MASVLKCPVSNCSFEIGDDVRDDCKSIHYQLHLLEHQANTSALTPSHKAEKLKRPCISVSNSTEDWNYFLDRWNNYKVATKLVGADVTVQLLECCDESLRKDLTRVHRHSLSSLDETELIKAIKRLAVIEENVLVSRYNLHSMQQDSEEPIRSFVARIKGQANICNTSTRTSINPRMEQNVVFDRTADSSDAAEPAAFDTLCACDESSSTTTTNAPEDFPNECATTIDHHIYDDVEKCWKPRQSDGQPKLKVCVKVSRSSYNHLRLNAPPNERSILTTAIADTGCQSSLAGINILSELNLKPHHLFKCRMRMRSVNGQAVTIAGAIFLTVKSTNQDGVTLKTKQMVYISAQVEHLYLSKEGCAKLGLIPKNFPVVDSCSKGPINGKGVQSIIGSFSALTSACSCRKRQIDLSKKISRV
ncbi:MAG: hypothetical protein AAFO91_10635 [Bacteroidota bacterium]